jgi:hypothetical protein
MKHELVLLLKFFYPHSISKVFALLEKYPTWFDSFEKSFKRLIFLFAHSKITPRKKAYLFQKTI